VTREQAESLAKLPLAGILREYPNAPQFYLNGPDDLQSPREVHPAFYGCFDWHSAVHGHWCLFRLMKGFRFSNEAEIRRALDKNLTAANLRTETAYLQSRPHFERMYGWAWVLALAQELRGWNDPDAARWADALGPLEGLIVKLMIEYLAKLTYPIRVGTHGNTAFALVLAWDYAADVGHSALSWAIQERAKTFYGSDAGYPAHLEPNGNDFLSPALVEADLMRRVMAGDKFPEWLESFLPGLTMGEPRTLFEPAIVSEHSDGQTCHLDGLNLSRAWSMRGLASSVREPQILFGGAERHLEAAMPFVASGSYMGEHWLATYAVLATGV